MLDPWMPMKNGIGAQQYRNKVEGSNGINICYIDYIHISTNIGDEDLEWVTYRPQKWIK